jgi:hypothetical protein
LGLGAGVAREVGEVAIPDGVRQGRLYQSLVDTTLRFLIEQVGGAQGVYKDDEKLPDNFLVRRTAGNAVEMLGVVAFPWRRGGWCRNLAGARLPRRIPRLSPRPMSKSEAGVRAPTPRRGHSAANQDGAIAAITFPRN